VDHVLGRRPAPASWNLEPVPAALRPHDVAVLVRRFTGSRIVPEIERVFRRRGIPFAIVGGANRAEARTLDSWHSFASLLLPGDRSVELVAVLEAAPYRVSEASVVELFEQPAAGTGVLARLGDESIARVRDARDADAMRAVRASIEEASQVWRASGFREFLVWCIESSPLRTRLLAEGTEPDAVDELLRELLDLADGLGRRGELTLSAFLDHLGASLDERKFREEGDVLLPTGRVAVMTVHQAKGLEFPAVAVVGVAPGKSRSEGFLVSRASGLYFGKETAGAWHRDRERAENHASERRMEEVEERCILYVAMTRARDWLWVSTSTIDGLKMKKDPEPWLFTELLESARVKGLAREIRDAGAARAHSADLPAATASSDDEAVSALRDWTALRRHPAKPVSPSAFFGDAIVTATWPDLAAFARCPLQFRLDREIERNLSDEAPATDTNESSVPPGVDPAAFGAFVHDALRRMAAGESVASAVEAVRLRHDFGARRAVADAAARALLDAALAAGVAGSSPTARAEVPVVVRMNRLVVRGIIDRLDTVEGGSLITDYKVGGRSEDYAFQVRVYAWAARRARVPAPVQAPVA
jgi:ATP-dependent exoDNAse (exonuclease V) beta subunit